MGDIELMNLTNQYEKETGCRAVPVSGCFTEGFVHWLLDRALKSVTADIEPQDKDDIVDRIRRLEDLVIDLRKRIDDHRHPVMIDGIPGYPLE